MKSLWGHFEVTLRSLWRHFAHFGGSLEIFWVYEGYFESTLLRFVKLFIFPTDSNDFTCFPNRFSCFYTTMGITLEHFGVSLWQPWLYEGGFASLLCHFGVTICHFGITFGHFGVTLASLWVTLVSLLGQREPKVRGERASGDQLARRSRCKEGARRVQGGCKDSARRGGV